jgi:hypothetical protein
MKYKLKTKKIHKIFDSYSELVSWCYESENEHLIKKAKVVK